MSTNVLDEYLTRHNLQNLLYTYQMDCVEWMNHMVRKKESFLNAFVPGLGKTITTCVLLQITLPRYVLVVCPTSTIFNVWIRNLLQHSFYYHIYRLKSNNVIRYTLDWTTGNLITGETFPLEYIHNDPHPYKVIVTNYHGVAPFPGVAARGDMSGNQYEVNCPIESTDPELIPLRCVVFDMVVADEIHNISNGVNTRLDEDMKRKKQLRYYRMMRLQMTPDYGIKIGLTGTPIQNRISDVVGIMTWLGIKFSSRIRPDEIKSAIKKYMWRVTEDDLHPALRSLIKFPEVPFEEITKDVIYETPEEADIYRIVAGKLVGATIPGGDMNPYSRVVYENNPLVRTNRECYLSADINMFINIHNKKYGPSRGIWLPTWYGSNSKMNMIANDIASFSYENRSFTCFIHYYEEEAAIKEKIASVGNSLGIGQNMGYYYFHLNGQQEPEDRDIEIRRMKSCVEQGFRCICFATIQSSSDGINMQFFDTGIIATSDWNPAKELQAIKRMHRIGQTKIVKIYRYVHRYIIDAENTKHIDIKKIDRQQIKTDKFIEYIGNTENAAYSWPIRDMPGFPGEKSVTFRDLHQFDTSIDPATGLGFINPETIANNISNFYQQAGITASGMQYLGSASSSSSNQIGYLNSAPVYMPPPINTSSSSSNQNQSSSQSIHQLQSNVSNSSSSNQNQNSSQLHPNNSSSNSANNVHLKKSNNIDVFDFVKYQDIFDIMSSHYSDLELYLRTAIYIDYLYKYNLRSDEITNTIDNLKTASKQSIDDFTDVFVMEDLLIDWYKHFSPDKIESVDDILLRYINCESELFNRLYKKYVDDSWVNVKLWFYNPEGEARMNNRITDDINTEPTILNSTSQQQGPFSFTQPIVSDSNEDTPNSTQMTPEQLRQHRLNFYQ